MDGDRISPAHFLWRTSCRSWRAENLRHLDSRQNFCSVFIRCKVFFVSFLVDFLTVQCLNVLCLTVLCLTVVCLTVLCLTAACLTVLDCCVFDYCLFAVLCLACVSDCWMFEYCPLECCVNEWCVFDCCMSENYLPIFLWHHIRLWHSHCINNTRMFSFRMLIETKLNNVLHVCDQPLPDMSHSTKSVTCSGLLVLSKYFHRLDQNICQPFLYTCRTLRVEPVTGIINNSTMPQEATCGCDNVRLKTTQDNYYSVAPR